jgi:general secretion pathway protein K
MLTLLSIVAAALSLETHFSTRIARNTAENAAVRAAADAGIQRAILDLATSTGAPTDGPGKFRADGTVYTWQFAHSTVHISVRDEGSKIDLNQAPDALLAALFASVGVDPGKAQSLADAIADFRDDDNLPRPRGAEEAEYRDAGLAWGPKNAPFQTVEELQQVLGVTPEIYARVAPDLTVYSSGTAVNQTLASTRLTEVLPGILRQAGFKYFVDADAVAGYSIRAEAKSSRGAVFIREAVVQLLPTGPYGSYPWILSWR